MITTEQFEELSERIRATFHPERIVLFGSYAEGNATEESDVDLLVVVETALRPQERYGAVRRLLTDFPAGFDIVVKTPAEYARSKTTVNHIVYFAEKYGKVLYERRET